MNAAEEDAIRWLAWCDRLGIVPVVRDGMIFLHGYAKLPDGFADALVSRRSAIIAVLERAGAA